MFTGIIKELGSVAAVEASDDGARLRIRADLASELGPGDSVAVNGACLTATSVSGGEFGADVMHQTLSLTTLGEALKTITRPMKTRIRVTVKRVLSTLTRLAMGSSQLSAISFQPVR